MSLPPPRVVPDLLPPLREDLLEVGFTVERLVDYLGPVVSAALEREQALPAERFTRADGSPLGALVRLFSLGVEVSFGAVDAALPRLGAEGLLTLGLADPTGAGLIARCDLRPHGDETRTWWVASDLARVALGDTLSPDHVLGIGGASLTVASWTPRRRVRRALDLGTGSGIQALHLSSHADEVVVTDTSERALRFARFNQALAGLEWDVRAGDMLEPVTGERFDLVVSNPPFVITPRAANVPHFEYRDAGRSGDAVVAGLVRGVEDVLTPGGVALFIGNWEVPRGADWRDRWREWLEPTGVDAWVVQRDLSDPAQYAETWARDAGHRPGSWMHDELYAAWLDDFSRRGVEAVGFGIVALQRPATRRERFVDLAESTGPVARPMGSHVAAGLAARTWLAEHDDAAVLAQTWRVADDVTEVRHARPGDPDPSVILVQQGGGLGRSFRVDTVTSALVGVCDGDLPAGAALTAIAALLERDADEVREQAVPFVRALVADGLLVGDSAELPGTLAQSVPEPVDGGARLQ